MPGEEAFPVLVSAAPAVMLTAPVPCAHENMTHTEAKDASCTEDGSIEYWYCPDCESYYSDADGENAITVEDTVLPAGHVFGEDHFCTVCGTPDKTFFKASGSCGDNLYWGLSSTGALTITGNGAMQNYSTGKAPWYSNRTSITSVSIGNDVTSIGSYAFENCTALTQITIPSGVTSIETRAFSGCQNLTTAELSEGLKGIGNYAFSDCAKLASAALPAGLEKINTQAFSGCSSLISVAIPASMISIGDDAFVNCTNLSSVLMPETVIEIGTAIFSNCGKLLTAGPLGGGYDYEFGWTEVIPDNAFRACSSLTSVTLPDSVTFIGRYAFSGCANLTEITIPAGVKTIQNNAFYNCKKLTSLVIPDSVTYIGDNAFNYCIALKSLSMPASISCTKGMFDGVTGLQSITLTGIGNMPDYNSNYANANYYQYTPWYISRESLTSVTIANGVKSIGSWAFYECSALTEITVPSSVTSIETRAFSNCQNLTSVTLSEGLKGIGNYAFSDCAKLASAALPAGLEKINTQAFSGCSSLTSVAIPASMISIGDDAFVNCTNLSSVLMPETVIEIGTAIFSNCGKLLTAGPLGGGYDYEFGWAEVIPDNAFRACSSLTSVTLPDSVTFIGRYAFSGCANLTEITIPAGVKTIQNNAFYNCKKLTSLVIPDSVTYIGDNAFNYCIALKSLSMPASISCTKGMFDGVTGLQSITLTGIGNMPDYNSNYANANYYQYTPWYISRDSLSTVTIENGVTSVGAWAFANCTGLKSISIPGSVTQIRGYTFYNCTNLTGVILSEGLSVIGYHAFDNCSSLTSLAIPSTMTGIGEYAFNYCNISSLTIPGSVTGIQTNAFTNCGELYTAGPIGGGYDYEFGWTEEIPDNAFQAFGKLTSITLPNSVTSIGERAFGGCKSLASLSIPAGVTFIGANAFSNCNSLTAITIPTGVTAINEGTFWYCTSLTELTIPNSVNTIGNKAFYCCFGLKKLTMPASICCRKGMFEGVTGLQSITLTGTGNMADCGSGSTDDNYKYTPWYISRDSLSSVTIANGVTSVGAWAFADCTGLKSISIPGSVTQIRGYTFYNCTNLTAVILSEGLSVIGYHAFENCSNLTSLAIPSTMTGIGEYAFKNCNISSLTIPGSVTGIQTNAFANCGELYTAGPIGGGYDYEFGWTEEIPDNAFQAFGKLTSITLPSSVTSIGGRAFSGCSGLTNITIPSGVTAIGSNAFSSCSGLKTLTMPASVVCTQGMFYAVTGMQSVTLTGTGAMADYSSSSYVYTPWYLSRAGLTSVTIENGVTNVGEYGFKDCTALTSVNLAASVESIGKYAFSGCSGLSSVKYGGEPPVLGTNAFENCPAGMTFYYQDILASVWAPNGETEWNGYLIESYKHEHVPKYVETVLPGCLEPGHCEYWTCTFCGKMFAEEACSAELSETDIILPAAHQYGDDHLCTVCGVPDPAYVKDSGSCGASLSWQLTENGILYIGGTGSMAHYTNGNAPWYVYKDDISKVILPEGLVRIGNSAFYGLSGISSITIPNSVTIIGTGAFEGCMGVSSVTVGSGNAIYSGEGNCLIEKLTGKLIFGCRASVIPESVTTIAEKAFYGCTGLTSIAIPASVTAIGNSAFEGCSDLETATFAGNPPATFGTDVFKSCASGFTVLYPDSAVSAWAPDDETSWNGYAVQEFADGHAHVAQHFDRIEPTCTETGNCEYWRCTACGKLFSDESCTEEIGKGNEVLSALGHSLTHTAAKAATCTAAGNCEYWYCSACKSYFLDSAGKTATTQAKTVIAAKGHSLTHTAAKAATCTAAGNCEYWYCSACKGYFLDSAGTTATTQAKTVIAAKGHSMTHTAAKAATCTAAGNCEYWYCSTCKGYFLDSAGKTSTTQAKTVIAAKDHSLTHTAAKAATCTAAGNVEYWYCSTCKGFFLDSVGKTATTQAKTVIAAAHKFGSDHVCTVCGEADPDWFAGSGTDNGNKWTVSPDGTLTVSGSGKLTGKAWADQADKLTSVTISDGVTAIGDGAFSGASKLTSVTIPSSVTSIGKDAFNGCASLKSVTVPDSVKSIGSGAFSGCSSLTSVKLPDGLTSIPDNAFKGCSKLASFTVPESVTSIGKDAFNGCASLKTITVPEGVTSVGSGVFSGCSGLTSAKLPDGLTSIPDNAFNGCSRLASFTVPESVTSIGAGAFADCRSMTCITILLRVKKIGANAFKGCSALKDVLYGGTASQWKGVSVGGGNESLNSALLHPVVTVAASKTKAKINWTQMTGVTGYMLYVRRDNETKPIKTVTIKKAKTVKSSYTMTQGHTYRFTLAPVVNGKVGMESLETIVEVPLDTPKLKAKVKGNTLSLSWSKVKGAEGFELAVTDSAGNTKTQKYGASTKKATLTVSPSGAYTISLTAYTALATSKTATVKGTVSLTATSLKAKASKGTVNLSWKQVKAADGYEIYRAEGSSTDFKLIATVAGSVKKYVDRGVTVGTVYTYKLRPVSRNTYAYGTGPVYGLYTSAMRVTVK